MPGKSVSGNQRRKKHSGADKENLATQSLVARETVLALRRKLATVRDIGRVARSLAVDVINGSIQPLTANTAIRGLSTQLKAIEIAHKYGGKAKDVNLDLE